MKQPITSRSPDVFPGGGEGSSSRSAIVKIFLDERVDWRSARDIIGHDVKPGSEDGNTPAW
jgi:hypothetical protein